MSYDMDGDKMIEVPRIGREQLSDKGTASVNERVDPLRSKTGLTHVEIVNRMSATLTGLYGLSASEITPTKAARRREVRHRGLVAPRPVKRERYPSVSRRPPVSPAARFIA